MIFTIAWMKSARLPARTASAFECLVVDGSLGYRSFIDLGYPRRGKKEDGKPAETAISSRIWWVWDEQGEELDEADRPYAGRKGEHVFPERFKVGQEA